MLALAGAEIIDLGSPGLQGPRVLPVHPEQHEFRHVAEIESDPAAVAAAILADFVPDDVGLVAEPPACMTRNPSGSRAFGTQR